MLGNIDLSNMRVGNNPCKHTIGPCLILYNGFDIGPTLKDHETKFATNIVVSEVKTDESADIKHLIATSVTATAGFSTLITQQVEDNFPHDKVTIGSIEFVSMTGNLRLIIPRAAITAAYSYNFKDNTASIAAISIKCIKINGEKLFEITDNGQVDYIVGGINV